jgi:hypothetical protein
MAGLQLWKKATTSSICWFSSVTERALRKAEAAV